MSFSIKQLLLGMAVVAVALAALLTAHKPFVATLVRLATLSISILLAYGIWTSDRETRAFRIGFLCWGGVFFLSNVLIQTKMLDLGVDDLADQLVGWFYPDEFQFSRTGTIIGVTSGGGTWLLRDFKLIFQCIVSLLLGFIGGWVTVYFYRKRQKMSDSTR